jgi:N,N-dimethylformamidase
MKLLGYVSDEQFVAIADAVAELESLATGEVFELRSSARGALRGDVPDGRYRVTLAKAGYGAKASVVSLGGEPIQFRLLSDRLYGYMWPKWCRAGDQAEYRLHSTEQCLITLWRYGQRREKVATVTWVDEHGPQANRQLLPDGDFTQTGTRWNCSGFPSPPVIRAPERGGLYYLWARTPSGAAFSFPWIVAPRTPEARIAVLAATNTWNAYNNFGGRSNYVNAARLPEAPIVHSRQDLDRYRDPKPFGDWRPPDSAYAPLSFDRPEPMNHLFDDPELEDPIRGRNQCHLAPAEWRLLGWMEREGFAYDLYSDAQLHEGTMPLDAYRVLALTAHPEYWSREMFVRVKAWVNGGGRLVYLGGNGLNCEVVFESDGSMRCLTHLFSVAGEMGGLSESGVRWESRMHRTFESEAGLLGVVCSESGIMTAAPYAAVDAGHWIFEGTGVRNGQEFGRETLQERVPGGASGHETDKRSGSSPANTRLLAKGVNADGGGAELVVVDPFGEGKVFSVGSITWIAALLTDPVVSRITSNVLKAWS